ncbi:hypothetical protein GWI33_010165 [Rhynchophorus ferrugineus]|uniref:Transposase n=1 Tax=Rhynchophorus ferrugineus TaxID=354439 RepID=A0A834IED9_RHYFE|nr:hypothetical protein GWI33_010165 [Rhynchophorus ferrugineus]
MDKKEFGVLIKYCFLKGKNTAEAKTWFDVDFLDTYFEKGRTINSDSYITLLDHLKEEIAEQRPHSNKNKVLVHQDNTPCHRSMKTMAKIHELVFELLPHPPYSPDLAPSYYFLISKFLRSDLFNWPVKIYDLHAR